MLASLHISNYALIESLDVDFTSGLSIITGETGAGKSTIVNLVCRFYEPTEGRILIDGTDYRQRSQLWLQSNLGYVLQSPHLFSGTIADNIRFGRPDATDAQVRAAAAPVLLSDESDDSAVGGLILQAAIAASLFRLLTEKLIALGEIPPEIGEEAPEVNKP
mgnify:CR=1 FL=1